MDTLQLNTGSLSLKFDRKTGALTGMTARETGWNILRREALGLRAGLQADASGRGIQGVLHRHVASPWACVARGG